MLHTERETPTALVVDDDPTARFLLRTALTELGYRVVEAELAVEGIQQVRELCPDLLILDILMPHMDGLDALKYLRSDARCAGVPVIVSSVLSEDHDLIRKCREFGILAYLGKPIDYARLAERIPGAFADELNKSS